ncbi:hypothetical protein LCGC14_0775080 [marine sediment metagenome]|uniref:Solute-binding protein family 5 domain-containing protein n=1 Tax=marine sediment metagenome TaxID=412755 RepID=A0A0F9SH71_9ZZZZ|nr:hypothetical protein [archaeon]
MKLVKNFTIAMILVAMLAITTIPLIQAEEAPSTSAVAGIPNMRSTEPPRRDTVWGVGAYRSPTQFRPLELPPMADAGMYEALFGYNSATEELVPSIGLSYEWSTDGSSVTIELNDNAEWSDGEALDATDVVYSYELTGKQAAYIDDFADRFDSFNVVDSDTVRFDVNPGYENSRQVEYWLQNDIPIVPEHVWTDIEDTEGISDFTGIFQNDWFEDDFPDEWKVISGPYAPVYRDAAETTAAYQYRGEDWWGEGILYQDIPNADEEPPKYIGSTVFASNTEQDLAFIQGDVDLYAGFYAKIWEVWEDAEEGDAGYYINSWFGQDAPYFLAASSIFAMAVNQADETSILAVPEFRQALAYAINYVPMPDAAASGYWSRAKPGFIDDNSAAHAPFYDADVTADHPYALDVDEAISLMNGIPGIGGNEDDGWTYNGEDVGPYSLVSVTGWGDVNQGCEMAAADILANLGIELTFETRDFNLFISSIADMDYDFAMSVMGNKIFESPQRFLDAMRGQTTFNKNMTRWNTAGANTFEALWQTLETAEAADYATALDTMQEILAEEIPEIPLFVNGYWYAFSEYQWTGWTSEDNNYQHATTSWTDNEYAIKTRFILNLRNTGRNPPSAAIPWFGLEFFVLIGIVSIVVLTGVRLKRKR